MFLSRNGFRLGSDWVTCFNRNSVETWLLELSIKHLFNQFWNQFQTFAQVWHIELSSRFYLFRLSRIQLTPYTTFNRGSLICPDCLLRLATDQLKKSAASIKKWFSIGVSVGHTNPYKFSSPNIRHVWCTVFKK